jgi:hypothetical protein
MPLALRDHVFAPTVILARIVGVFVAGCMLLGCPSDVGCLMGSSMMSAGGCCPAGKRAAGDECVDDEQGTVADGGDASDGPHASDEMEEHGTFALPPSTVPPSPADGDSATATIRSTDAGISPDAGSASATDQRTPLEPERLRDASAPPSSASPGAGCGDDSQCTAPDKPRCEGGRCVACRTNQDCGIRECRANMCVCRNGAPPVNGSCCGNGWTDPDEECDIGAGDGRELWNETTCNKATCTRIFWRPCGPKQGLDCPPRSRCEPTTGTCSPTTCPSDDMMCPQTLITSRTSSQYVKLPQVVRVDFPPGACPQQPLNTGLNPAGSSSLWCLMSCIRNPCPAPLRCNSSRFCAGPEATDP